MEDPTVEVAPLVDSDAALKPFLQAAQESSSSKSTLLALVQKVLSDPEIFAGFDEIKAIVVAALSLGKEQQQHDTTTDQIVQTLDLFSYGTYTDYVSDKSKFLTLTDTQLAKLRQLTVLSLMQETCRRSADHLAYANVQQALQLEPNHTRAVEQVLISCQYAGILSGRLCQKTQSLQWTGRAMVLSRDVPLTAVPDLVSTVQALQARLQATQQYLEQSERSVQDDLQRDAFYWKRIAQQQNDQRRSTGSGANLWSTAMVGHPGLLTTEHVTSAAAELDVTGRCQKRSRGWGAGGGSSAAFPL